MQEIHRAAQQFQTAKGVREKQQITYIIKGTIGLVLYPYCICTLSRAADICINAHDSSQFVLSIILYCLLKSPQHCHRNSLPFSLQKLSWLHACITSLIIPQCHTGTCSNSVPRTEVHPLVWECILTSLPMLQQKMVYTGECSWLMYRPTDNFYT